MNAREKLIEAEAIALDLFGAIEQNGLIVAGKTEGQLNNEIFKLADSLFGIKKYWHKRIVRSGKNTLRPYDDNPPELTLQPDDILFFDFGPILEDWEADIGRTYVLGNDETKIKLKTDIEMAWHQTQEWFRMQTHITGAQVYEYVCKLALYYGWTFGGEIAGHLIGKFPHEKLEAENHDNYIHPQNQKNMMDPDHRGQKREWILEIHFVDQPKEIGGFFEQLLT